MLCADDRRLGWLRAGALVKQLCGDEAHFALVGRLSTSLGVTTLALRLVVEHVLGLSFSHGCGFSAWLSFLYVLLLCVLPVYVVNGLLLLLKIVAALLRDNYRHDL